MGAARLTQPQLAVGAIVFRQDAVLLVQRNQPPKQGEWAIPGGKVNLGETLQHAAEREVLEETGIQIRAFEPVYAFDLIETDEQGELRWHYVIVDPIAEYVAGEPLAASDARQARWVTRSDMEQLKINTTTRTLLEDMFDFSPGEDPV